MGDFRTTFPALTDWHSPPWATYLLCAPKPLFPPTCQLPTFKTQFPRRVRRNERGPKKNRTHANKGSSEYVFVACTCSHLATDIQGRQSPLGDSSHSAGRWNISLSSTTPQDEEASEREREIIGRVRRPLRWQHNLQFEGNFLLLLRPHLSSRCRRRGRRGRHLAPRRAS